MGRRKRRKKLNQFNVKFNPKLFWAVTFFIIAFLLFSGLAWAIYTSEVFEVKKESIVSNVVLNKSLEKKIRGESLFSIDIKEISFSILKEHPEYKQVYTIKRFPNTLAIEVIKRDPLAQLKGRRYYLIDNDAVIISDGYSNEVKNLITIETEPGRETFRRGYEVKDSSLRYALDLIGTLKSSNFIDDFKVNRINSTSREAIYLMVDKESFSPYGDKPNEDIKVIIGEDNFLKKINIFKELLEEKLQGKISLVKYIDLRYKKVYVGFKR